MNKRLLEDDVQLFLKENSNSDPAKTGLNKSPFAGVTSAELATQLISRKKAEKKLPTWFTTEGIYYPAPLSIEQTSSEATAAFKASLVSGVAMVDLTAGLGVDDLYFSRTFTEIIACETNSELAAIHAHNAAVLGVNNIKVLAADGVDFLLSTPKYFDLIYADPVRRGTTGKVFMLRDCSPDLTGIMDLLLEKGRKIMIKTSPLLDISAGLGELKQVSDIYVVSVRNECKELLWVLDSQSSAHRIHCVTLNEQVKTFSFYPEDARVSPSLVKQLPSGYLYEPDAALLKGGAFNLIGERFSLQKLHKQTQLYTSDELVIDFPGRVFEITNIYTPGEFKKRKTPLGNVIVRNYPDKAENLVKKHKICPSKLQFLIFTEIEGFGLGVIEGKIVQYY